MEHLDNQKYSREKKRFELTIYKEGEVINLKGIGYWEMYECLARMCAEKEGVRFEGKVLKDVDDSKPRRLKYQGDGNQSLL